MEEKGVWLLAVVLLLECRILIEGGEIPSTEECAMDSMERKNCGYSGISVEDCKSKGCCFDAKYPGVPWCFYPHLKKGTDECSMDVKERKNCGYSGISVKDCKSKGCCFDAKYPGVPWCFYPLLKKGRVCSAAEPSHSNAMGLEVASSVLAGYFNASIKGVPWCFIPYSKPGAGECAMDVKERKNCGYSGISVKDCTSKGCCFDAKYPGVPWCFYPLLKK
ncbi:unnamed protein product, partial [Lepidochelys kempii]